jgi:SNF2 family DNA or RNA helicase
MAHIDYRNNLFYGLGSFEERAIWSKAGFKWSPVRKAWVTADQEVATRVEGVTWTQRAFDHVEHQLETAKISHELSWRANTDFMPPCPPGKAYLPYQRAGIEFALMRKDTLIADQPGLGKTIQAVGVINADESVRSVLVICPASLKENWRREIDAWMVADLSFGIAEAQREERVQIGVWKSGKKAGQPRYRTVEVQKDYWPDTDIVIINYDILERFPQIKERSWDLLVCDECHALKTPTTGRTLFVLGDESVEPWKRKKLREDRNAGKWFTPIDANRRVFLSGTPMMSRPVELWPIATAFDPQGLGKKFTEFAYRFCGAYSSQHGLVAKDATNLVELGERMRSKFMIRRLKREVLPELPPKRRIVVPLDSPEIRELVAREDELAQALRLYEQVTLGRGVVVDEAVTGEQIVNNMLNLGVADIDPEKPNWKALDLTMPPPWRAWSRRRLRSCSRRWRRSAVNSASPSCPWSRRGSLTFWRAARSCWCSPTTPTS